MDRLTIIGVVALTACVGGCAQTWLRRGADAADLNRVKFECQFEAAKTITSGKPVYGEGLVAIMG
jgi:fructose-specific phosphotransferase system component IIB